MGLMGKGDGLSVATVTFMDSVPFLAALSVSFKSSPPLLFFHPLSL